MKKEQYHTLMEYQNRGLDPYLDHIKDYLECKRPLPVSKVNSNNSKKNLKFTFSLDLLLKFLYETEEIEKPYEVAIKYGLRGYSKGGMNGIFYLSEKSKINEKVDCLRDNHLNEVVSDLGVSKQEIDQLKKVKIVWHNPLGKRLVGLCNTNNNRIIFLDFLRY